MSQNNAGLTYTGKVLKLDAEKPVILAVTSSKTAGTYKSGDTIDLKVDFSEPVSSTADLVLSLELAAAGTDADGNDFAAVEETVTIASSALTTAVSHVSVSYTVKAGDLSQGLSVSSITGTLSDAAGNEMAAGGYTGYTNLSANNAGITEKYKV